MANRGKDFVQVRFDFIQEDFNLMQVVCDFTVFLLESIWIFTNGISRDRIDHNNVIRLEMSRL